MRHKQISKRRWKTRLKRGLWIPRVVVEIYSLTAPEGLALVWHPEEDFIGLSATPGRGPFAPYIRQKRAWE